MAIANKSYRKLIVWGKLKILLVITYELTNKLPRSEEFILRSQMRRAVISVLSNFVEGYLKRSTREKLHFLEIAETSLMELEAQSEVCLILKYWSEEESMRFEKVRGLAAYFLNKYRAKVGS
jgi:four helix bundle protein